jgi:hypothetical protein
MVTYVESVVVDVLYLTTPSFYVIIVSDSIQLEVHIASDWQVFLHMHQLAFGFVSNAYFFNQFFILSFSGFKFFFKHCFFVPGLGFLDILLPLYSLSYFDKVLLVLICFIHILLLLLNLVFPVLL